MIFIIWSWFFFIAVDVSLISLFVCVLFALSQFHCVTRLSFETLNLWLSVVIQLLECFGSVFSWTNDFCFVFFLVGFGFSPMAVLLFNSFIVITIVHQCNNVSKYIFYEMIIALLPCAIHISFHSLLYSFVSISGNFFPSSDNKHSYNLHFTFHTFSMCSFQSQIFGECAFFLEPLSLSIALRSPLLHSNF